MCCHYWCNCNLRKMQPCFSFQCAFKNHWLYSYGIKNADLPLIRKKYSTDCDHQRMQCVCVCVSGVRTGLYLPWSNCFPFPCPTQWTWLQVRQSPPLTVRDGAHLNSPRHCPGHMFIKQLKGVACHTWYDMAWYKYEKLIILLYHTYHTILFLTQLYHCVILYLPLPYYILW